jgi:hypothetical protein
VVVSDFLAMGGDDILTPVMPDGGFPVDHGARPVRDVLIEYLERPGAPLREQQLLDRASPLLSVPGLQPLLCTAA